MSGHRAATVGTNISVFKWRYNQLDAASDLLIINQFSTCSGRVYAHLQEVELPYTAYGF
jgi:hypothetical protein